MARNLFGDSRIRNLQCTGATTCKDAVTFEDAVTCDTTLTFGGHTAVLNGSETTIGSITTVALEITLSGTLYAIPLHLV